MGNSDQLLSIITAILNNDNHIRQENEVALAQLQSKDFDQYLATLAHLLNGKDILFFLVFSLLLLKPLCLLLIFSSSFSESLINFTLVTPRRDIKTFCLLDLQHYLSSDNKNGLKWHQLRSETQRLIKESLNQNFLRESESSEKNLSNLISDVIGILLISILGMDNFVQNLCSTEGRQWDSIFEDVWTFLASENTLLLTSGLKILSVLAQYRHPEFLQQVDELVPMLKQSLEAEDLRVKSYAIQVISRFFENAESKDCKPFLSLIPLLLQAILIIVEKDEDLVNISR